MNDRIGFSASGDLDGRNVVITGATDGIGRVAARRLAAMGANVLIVGRDPQKTHAVVRALADTRLAGTLACDIADLSLQRDVQSLAVRITDRMPCVDVLINNAGAIFSERALTDEGLERTFALNHLAYFSLTLLLLPALYAAGNTRAPSRIINVASRAHVRARLDLQDLQSARSFRGWRTYNNTKLENILFTRALSGRLDPRRVVTHALHPGVVATRFAVAGNGVWGRFMRAVMNLNAISPERGADTIVHVTTAAEAAATTGLYWDKCAPVKPSAAARDDSDAEALWRVSASLANIDADNIVRQASAHNA